MDAQSRRQKILEYLSAHRIPVSAASLARQMDVSRQIIVGDIALLRAQGSGIVATARGYAMINTIQAGRYMGKIACQHAFRDTEKELRSIVDGGAEVLNVIVEHHIYGEITGQLNIATQEDVDVFLQKLKKNEARLLSELTGGIHLHTVACRDVEAFERIQAELNIQSLLYRGD